MPPIIVAPERDVPGTSAQHCARPTFSASRQFRSSTDSMRGAPALAASSKALPCGCETVPRRASRHSASRITTPPTINAMATLIGLNRWALIHLPKIKASTMAGTLATMTLMANRWAFGSDPRPLTTAPILRRNSQHTARIAPN
ncbi:hypothetical protein D3C81_1687980 [compost metagenome]